MAGPARIRSTRFLVATLVGVSLLTITVDYRGGENGPLAATSRALIAILAPLQQAVSNVTEPVGEFFTSLVRLPQLRRDNDALRDQVARLQQELATSSSDARRLEQLEALLDLQSRLGPTVDTFAVQVIASGVSNFEWTVQIGAGSSDGIEVGMPVVASAGLVGRVVRVAPNASTVQLILDPDSAVAGRLGSNGATGIVVGGGDSDLRMGLVDTSVSVTAEDAVVTAGYEIAGAGGGIYPPGILIGQVSRVVPDPAALETYITLRPAVDFDTLDVVLVIRSTGGA